MSIVYMLGFDDSPVLTENILDPTLPNLTRYDSSCTEWDFYPSERAITTGTTSTNETGYYFPGTPNRKGYGASGEGYSEGGGPFRVKRHPPMTYGCLAMNVKGFKAAHSYWGFLRLSDGTRNIDVMLANKSGLGLYFLIDGVVGDLDITNAGWQRLSVIINNDGGAGKSALSIYCNGVLAIKYVMQTAAYPTFQWSYTAAFVRDVSHSGTNWTENPDDFFWDDWILRTETSIAPLAYVTTIYPTGYADASYSSESGSAPAPDAVFNNRASRYRGSGGEAGTDVLTFSDLLPLLGDDSYIEHAEFGIVASNGSYIQGGGLASMVVRIDAGGTQITSDITSSLAPFSPRMFSYQWSSMSLGQLRDATVSYSSS